MTASVGTSGDDVLRACPITPSAAHERTINEIDRGNKDSRTHQVAGRENGFRFTFTRYEAADRRLSPNYRHLLNATANANP